MFYNFLLLRGEGIKLTAKSLIHLSSPKKVLLTILSKVLESSLKCFLFKNIPIDFKNLERTSGG